MRERELQLRNLSGRPTKDILLEFLSRRLIEVLSNVVAEAALDQALGELSELYSRRAEEMSGEVLIETEAGPQELQTPYSPSEAGHRDPGGVIRRDQIPHAYRHFIQKYFEALQEKN